MSVSSQWVSALWSPLALTRLLASRLPLLVLSCALGPDPFREDVEGSEAVRKLKLFVQHYHAYLHFRASDASDDISRLLLPPPLPLIPPTEAPEGSTEEAAVSAQAAEKAAGEESLTGEEGGPTAPEAPAQSPVASAIPPVIPPASGTPVRRRLASATAALNRLMTLALECNGFLGEIADHPVIRPCLACVAEVRGLWT